MDWHNELLGRAGATLCLALAVAPYPGAAIAQQISGETSSSRPSQATASTLRGSTTFGRSNNAQTNNTLTNYDNSSTRDNADLTANPSDDGATSVEENTNRDLDPDIRRQQDRDAFESPPAGHDPRFFQIERVTPQRDRRTQQFFEADPFAHIGWRLGSFILFQELEVSAAWDSNVFFSPDANSDSRADFTSETRLVSDWSNHALEFRMLHDRTYHRDFNTENDAEQTYELRGRLDITSRTTAEALLAREIRQESRNSVDTQGAITNARPDVITDRATLVLNHRFNRLSLQLRGAHADTEYEELTPGLANDRDVEIQSLAVRAQWEFRPTFSIFGELEVDTRRHPAVTLTDGLRRDSKGERYRTGVALGQTGEFFRGEASVGYGIQRPKESALPDIETFLVDANVAWRISPLTSLLFDARTAINETTVIDSPGVVDRTLGVRIRHAFRRRLVGEAGVSYGTQDYQGATLEERNVTLSSSVEYTLNRHAALFGRAQHIRFRSTDADRDYNASTIMFGARLRN